MRQSIIILISLLFITKASASITEGGQGMLFGGDHTFTITAISGWVLDNQSAVNQGLHMVFYPKGSTWSNSPVIIYGRAAPTGEIPSIKSQVEKTVSDFKNNGNPDYKAKELSLLELSDGKKAKIVHFSGDQWGNYEAVAYIQEKDTINYLVFNSRKKESFDDHINDFYQIVKSYRNIYVSSSKITKDKLNSLKKESVAILKKKEGKKYESTAIQAVGQSIANSMKTCASYLKEKDLPDFNYFVRIAKNGNIIESIIYPTMALSNCFNGLMSNIKYPAHSFENFLLNIEMKIKP